MRRDPSRAGQSSLSYSGTDQHQKPIPLNVQPVALKARRGAFGAGLPFELINNTGYSTEDLVRFCVSGLRALGARAPKRIAFVAAPRRSRGCAEVGTSPGYTGVKREARDIVIAMAPPSRFTMRRLARLFQHEVTHSLGYEHDEMDKNVLWSLGPVPDWAKGLKIRYQGRAPSQIP